MKPNLAAFFGVPRAKLRIITPYVGGGFGGKVGNETMLEPLAVLAAIKSRRPVRLVNTREDEFVGGSQRGDVVTYIKDGVRKDGALVARQIKAILNLGRHSHVGHVLARNIAFGAVGTYRIDNFRWDSYGVYTNMPPTGAFRGFGSPEVNWAIEQQMDILAGKLGIDPVEIRKKNMLREGDKDACGQTTVAIGLDGCLDAVAKAVEWGSNKPGNEEGPWRKGKGLAIGNKYSVSMPASATVKVHSDGGVEVRHGNVEVGQGLNTVLAQIAAEEFGIAAHDVKIVYGDTAVCPPDHGCIFEQVDLLYGQRRKARVPGCQEPHRRDGSRQARYESREAESTGRQGLHRHGTAKGNKDSRSFLG